MKKVNNGKFKNPVLILGGNRNGLWVARELGKHGIDIHIVAEEKTNIAFQSKYCKKKVIVPGPWSCQELIRILRRMAQATTQRLVVYPITDMHALYLSKVKDYLPDDYYFVVGEKEATETLVNKRKFYQALDKNGVDHPTTHFPQDFESAKNIGKKVTYPVFVRPSITELFYRVFGYRKGFVASSYGELLNYYRLATSGKVEILFQEIIPGPPTNSYQLEGYFNKEFCTNGLFARQRLRIWPLNFGNTTLCVSVPLSEFTSESKKVTEFIKNIAYHGLVSAEFKKDARDGKHKLLEINARPWRHFWLSTICGVDILFSSYLDAIGEKIPYYQEYAVGFKSLYFLEDLNASAKMFSNGELGFLEWALSLKGVKRLTLFDKGDSFPLFRQLPKILFSYLSVRSTSA